MRYLLIALVRVYQLTVRRFHSRTCLFNPTCSHFALDTLRSAESVWHALRLVRARLRLCRPPFQLLMTGEHSLILITHDGKEFRGGDVNKELGASLIP